MEAADEALRQAIATDEYESLSAALDAHHEAASKSVLAAAREKRDKGGDRGKAGADCRGLRSNNLEGKIAL